MKVVTEPSVQKRAARSRSTGAPVVHRRDGLILVAVLVLVAMLALGAYSFSYLLSTEAAAVQNRGRMVQARLAAESAVVYVEAFLLDLKLKGELGVAPLDDPSVFEPMPLSITGTVDNETPYFICVAPDESGNSVTQVRFGITDETARPNLNVLATEWYREPNPTGEGQESGSDGQGDTARSDGEQSEEGSGDRTYENPLLYLPSITPEVADAVFDWIDPDDDPRSEGAESETYQGLSPPYEPRNGKIVAMEELLLVRGVTPRILYGEDADFDGVLDWNENDGADTYPYDDADGTLDRGIARNYTLYSVEPNLDSTGQPRIDLNSNDLEALYDQLAAEFGEELARFVVAYRLFGPQQESGGEGDEGDGGGEGGQEQAGQGDGTSQREEVEAAVEPSGGQPGAPSDEQQGEGSSVQELVGLDASEGPQREIASVAELINARVLARLAERDENGQPRTEELESPLTDSTLDSLLPDLLDRTTTQADQELFYGRINVNTASREALLAVPGMTEDYADLILTARPLGAELGGSAASTGMAWLLTDGVLTPEEYMRFERYLTGRSFVYRVQAIGCFPGLPVQARVEAVVDVSGTLPRVRAWQDLSRFGRGIDGRTLLTTAGITTAP